MMTALLPLVAFVLGQPPPSASAPSASASSGSASSASSSEPPARDDLHSASGRAAARLAHVLAEADSIEAVHAEPRGHVVAFAIVDRGVSWRVTAYTDARAHVRRVAVARAAAVPYDIGALSWLSSELANADAVARLVVDEDGGVLVETTQDRRYLVMPGRGSGGSDAAVDARWAGEWNAVRDES